MSTIFLLLKEPLLSSGYICSFNNLEIKSVLLDEIFKVTISIKISCNGDRYKEMTKKKLLLNTVDINISNCLVKMYFQIFYQLLSI